MEFAARQIPIEMGCYCNSKEIEENEKDRIEMSSDRFTVKPFDVIFFLLLWFSIRLLHQHKLDSRCADQENRNKNTKT